MKIAFFGTPDFTTAFLDTLSANDLAPSLVVTNPDRAAGRGMEVHSPAPKVWAQDHGIPSIQPEKITQDVLDEFAKESWDLFVVIAYGAILPAALIDLPRLGTINVHYSLLPAYRGASPVEAAILAGDAETGISIQRMRFKLDSGPLIGTRAVAIDASDTTETLREKLNRAASAILPDVIRALDAGTATCTEQDETHATHVGKLDKKVGDLDGARDDTERWNIFRAISGRGWAYLTLSKDGKAFRAKITKARFENGKFVVEEFIPPNGKRQTLNP